MAESNFTIEELESEEWRVISEFPDYAASSLGRIKRITRGRRLCDLGKILRDHPAGGQSLYRGINLRRGDTRVRLLVHQVIAMAFLDPPNEGETEIDHLDNAHTNNRASNLEWVTHQENIRRRGERGRTASGKRQGAHTKPESRRYGTLAHACVTSEDTAREIKRLLRETKMTAPQISAVTGSSVAIIYHIKNGKAWAWLE